jgi:hypothetical protein
MKMRKNNGDEEKENERISRIWTEKVEFGEHDWREISNIFEIPIHEGGQGRLGWIVARNGIVQIGNRMISSKGLPYYLRNLWGRGVEKINLLEPGNAIPILAKGFKRVKSAIKTAQDRCDDLYGIEGISRQDKLMAEKASIVHELTLDVSESKFNNSRLLKPVKSYLSVALSYLKNQEQ